MKRILILGGGTFNPIRNHLSLAAPAFGKTARILKELIPEAELVLTKMADSNSKLVTNEDVRLFIEEQLKDPDLSVIIMNAAICDFESQIGDIPSGLNSERLKTSQGDIQITLTPSDKLLKQIRIQRPDIFLVGFKTTTGEDENTQFLTALKMMKSSKCNLVLANDLTTKLNMVITAEETIYGQTTDRYSSLKELVDILKLRMNGTYNRTKFIEKENVAIEQTPESFRKVLKFLINNQGFIENNGNGFTPGHFCYKNSENSMISSQRKSNHNKVFSEGMGLVSVDSEGQFTAEGIRKPSVGARSQWILLNSYPEYDCIVHTHNPLKVDGTLSTVDQRPFQCGSLECGINTLQGIADYDGIKAVYLKKHGANIIFKSTDDPEKVIEFIKKHLELGVKVK